MILSVSDPSEKPAKDKKAGSGSDLIKNQPFFLSLCLFLASVLKIKIFFICYNFGRYTMNTSSMATYSKGVLVIRSDYFERKTGPYPSYFQYRIPILTKNPDFALRIWRKDVTGYRDPKEHGYSLSRLTKNPDLDLRIWRKELTGYRDPKEHGYSLRRLHAAPHPRKLLGRHQKITQHLNIYFYLL